MGFKHTVLSGIISLSLLISGTYTKISAADDFILSDSLVVSEENRKETVQKVSENISGLLQALGLMDEREINSEGYVTREIAADILLRFDKIYDGGTATGKMYIDVPAENTYAYEVETASKCGYFFGTGDGKFNPDGNITSVQMATVLLRLAGYRNDYFSTSAEIGKLLKNAGGYKYMTYAGLANMLYDFLDINIVKINGIYADCAEYKKSRTETVLNSCFDIYKCAGVITENSITGLWSDSDLGKNKVVVSGNDGNIIIGTGETDAELMIGRYVDIYYKYDKNEDLSVCVYYDAADNRNTITEIDLCNIDCNLSTDNLIEYYPDNIKRHKIKYNKKTAILYNGTYYSETGSFLQKVSEKEGKLTVIDNDGDGTADVFNIEAYDTFIVNSVVLRSGTVFSKNTNQPLSLKEENFDRFSITDESGNKVFIEDFVEGMVLSVAENNNDAKKRTIKVLVSENKINGTVTGLYRNDFDRDVIQLDNMNDYTMLNTAEIPAIGQGVTIMLNVFGKVAWVDYSNAGNFAYGIITNVSKDKASHSSVLVKMITAKNTIEIFEVKDKITVDKDIYKDMDELYKKLNRQDNLSVGNYKFPEGVYPVRYKLRADGSLAELDTSNIGAKENDNTFELIVSGNHMLQNELIMGGSFAVRESTPVFKITASADSNDIVGNTWFDDTRYTAMSNVKSLMSVGESYNYAAYRVDKDSVFADFIIIYSSWGQSYTDKLFVVEKIGSVYDDVTGQVLKSVHGAENGVEKDIVISDLYEKKFDEIGLECGDVIRYRVDGYNHLIKVEGDSAVIKHNDDNIMINNISSGQTSLEQFKKYASSTQMIFGYVLERRDNYITISVIQPGTVIDGKRSQADMEKDTILLKIPNTVPITVYNPSEKKKVFVATYDEILDYKYSNHNCSLVALHYRTARLLEVVVLNNYALYS